MTTPELRGRGLFVGAARAAPPQLPPDATARDVDVDGLAATAVASQDFILDPALPKESDLGTAIEARLMKLKPGGILLCALPEADLPVFLAARPAKAEATVSVPAGSGGEVTVALRKTGAGAPTASPAPDPEVAAQMRDLKADVARLQRELEASGRDLERVKGSRSWRATEPLRAAKARLGGRG